MRNIKVYSAAWYNVRYRGVKSYNRKKDRKKKQKRISFHTFPNKNKVDVTTKSLVEKCRRKNVESGFEKKNWESAKGALISGLHLEFGAFEKHPIVAFCVVHCEKSEACWSPSKLFN